MTVWPDLRETLQGIPWAVVGGVATRAYMPERVTQDLDILVRQSDGDEVIERLKAAGYKLISKLAVPGFLLRSPEGIEVDVIFGKHAWLQEALSHLRVDAAGLPVLDLPYLAIMKIEASRGRDVGDLTTMLGLASDQELQRVRQVVARYAPQDVDDLESLICLGKLEMQGTL